MNPILSSHLGSTSVITAWCHFEGGEGGSLFLKPDIFKEQVPKLSIGEKTQCPSDVRSIWNHSVT